MRHTRLAPLWRALPGIGIAAVAVFAAFAVATGGGAPGPVYAGSSKHTMGGMDMGAMQGTSYWQDVSGGAFHSDGTTRTYYISADQVDWNYAPAGMNEITGKPFDDVADTYVKTGPGRIGSTLREVPLPRLHRRDVRPPHGARPAEDRYLGLLGPVIRAEVGDTIKVVFRNTCPFPASVHPHGVFYDKDSEGAPYNDGTHGAEQGRRRRAAPAARHTYTWEVPDARRARPRRRQLGDVDVPLAHRRGVRHLRRPDGADGDHAPGHGPAGRQPEGRRSRDLRAVLGDEREPEPVPRRRTSSGSQSRRPADPDDEDFQESNLMHSINGYVFGNQPMITMHRGEHVRWYVMSMGTEVDLHTPHWHGNTVTVNGMRMDVVSLLPATMVVADMVPDDAGIWLFHCHVNDHIRAGMLTRYKVLA